MSFSKIVFLLFTKDFKINLKMNNIKIFSLSLINKFKSNILYPYLIGLPIDEKMIILENKIDPKFATKNFNHVVSFYGLNSFSISGSFIKLWSHLLYLGYWIAQIKFFIAFYLDPINDYKLCLLIGDLTIFIQSLRKFLLLVLMLMVSFAICSIRLFNRNPNTKWFEIFKCFDGMTPPKSVGMRDKKIVIKMLILTKLGFKFIKIVAFLFTLNTFCFFGYLFYRNVKFHDEIELLAFLFWFLVTTLGVYFVCGTIFTSSVCFQIITFYCFIMSRHFNQLIRNVKIELQFGCKRFIMKLKIKNLIRNQKEFTIRILKYNKFWRKFYLIMMLHLFPANVICSQQIFFGNLSFELRFMYMMGCIIGIGFIVSTSLFVCLLAKEMKIHHHKLIQLQFDSYLNLDTNTKLKVMIFVFFKFQIIKIFFNNIF